MKFPLVMFMKIKKNRIFLDSKYIILFNNKFDG